MFTFKFIAGDSHLQLELLNTTDQTLKRVEVLTIFLKDEATNGGPSLAHIRFEPVEVVKPHDSTVLRHRTWGDGKPAAIESDQIERLQVLPGKLKPYVLDISWEDSEGKTRFQRIPVGH